MTNIQTILVACDLSSKAQKVLAYAIGLAQHLSAKLYILHVQDARDVVAIEHAFGSISSASNVEDLQAYLNEYHHEACTYLESLLPANCRDQIDYHIIVRQGQPHAQIVAEVKKRGADLLVIGEGHHGYLAERFVGTTANRLLRLLSIPMVSLRGERVSKANQKHDKPK